MNQEEISPSVLRAAFGYFPSGIAALCAEGDDGPLGMAVSTFVPVSLKPALIAVCLQETSRTWPLLRLRRRLGVSILAEHHATAARSLSMKDGDRFAAVPFLAHPAGDIEIGDCSAYFECGLDHEVAAGDHLLAILRVHRVRTADAQQPPLVFHRSGFTRLLSATA